MRTLEIQLKDNKTILMGVASDYANKYPDAPNMDKKPFRGNTGNWHY